MAKSKTIDASGKITVSKAEERFPYSSEILMTYGFKIIFLNMAFGLLPVTIWGPRMKYFKCSISQLYTLVSCLAFIILSVIFVQAVFIADRSEPGPTTLIVLVMMSLVQVLGYIILLLRGHFVAYKLPLVWTKLSKLLQISVLDVYGTNYHLLKEAQRFSVWAVAQFILVILSSMSGVIIISNKYSEGLRRTYQQYNLKMVLPLYDHSPFQYFQYFCFHAGYFLWQASRSCHVLIAMLLCYIVIIVTICLKSVNQQLQELLEIVGYIQDYRVAIRVSKIKFNWWGKPTSGAGLTRLQGGIYANEDDAIISRLETTKTIFLTIEDLLGSVSKIWGISLIVEVLILITSATTSAFDFLSSYMEGNKLTVSFFAFKNGDQWIALFVTLSVHFFFLFRCCTIVERMKFEAKSTLHLLKQASSDRVSSNVYRKIRTLKNDLTSMSLSLSANNYFQINKVLLTSVFSQITTYVIVLMQFAHQAEKDANACKDE